MLKLGLLENKKYFEQLLSEKLERSIAQRDAGSGQPRKPGRRRRPLRERANSMAQQMTNVIRAKVVNDDDGRRVYTVNVLMGEFTQDVRHVTTGHVVVLSGSTPAGGGPKLSKDVTIEFPDGVDMDELSMAFVAGVYKLRVPFRYRRDSLPVTHVLSAPTNDRILSNGSARSACRTMSGSSGYDTLSCVSTPSAPVDSDNENDDEKVFRLNSDPEIAVLQNGVTRNTPDDTAPGDDNTTAPVDDTTASVDDTTAPVVDTTVNVDDISSVDDTTASDDDTTASDDDTTAPVNDTTVPVNDTTAPVNDTTVPVDNTTASDDDTTAPVNDTTAPVNDTTAPVNDTTVPVDNTTASDDDTTAPFDDTAAPVDDIASLDDATTPVDDTTVNVDDTTVNVDDAASFDHTTSVNDTPANVDDTPSFDDTAVDNTHSQNVPSPHV